MSLISIKLCPTKYSTRDPIPTTLLKRFAEHLAIPITNLINLSITTDTFPDEMKLAYVTPLLKKPNICSDDLNNYRPVSLLIFLSKLIERLVCQQLSEHLSKNDLYVPVQSAYRKDHSTETALLKVLNDLLLAIDGCDAAVLTLLDQSAAFDMVDHSILISRLTALFGISGTIHSWFLSYLSNRSQSICIKGTTSPSFTVHYGVPQRSVLGPILFTL